MNNSSVVFSDELAHAKFTIPHQNYTSVVVNIHIHSTVSPEHRCRNLFSFFFFLSFFKRSTAYQVEKIEQ